METELTKQMKKASHFYKPLMNIQNRTIRYADEVWTPTGIVDSIRFEDYIVSRVIDCSIINYSKYSKAEMDWMKEQQRTLGKCKVENKEFPNKECSGCFYKKMEPPVVGMCVTCFECKITLSDFKSIHGHNFHGNRNYYVVPKELAKQIETLVPSDIGIISWVQTDCFAGLRMYRECQSRIITDELKCKLLYNAMKKWCDNAFFY
jgi:hypothetical protein